jgi:hypothetical protein
MEFLTKIKNKLSYDLSKITLFHRFKLDLFTGEIVYIDMYDNDKIREIVYLSKAGFFIHLKEGPSVIDGYIVTIYFNPVNLDEIKFYINNLNKRNKNL